MDASKSAMSPVRVAVEGCGHGCLHDIYASVETTAALKGWDGVDLVIIGGDFQAARNSNDIGCMSVPAKYKAIGDFHEYYSGKRTAPYLTIFVGGNHEASNHMFELYYGGWVAPNIYYLGAANVIQYGPLRIAGMSGIWKGYDYRKPHHERLPYNSDDIQSIYHVRELDVRKLLQIRTQVDIGLSHDWPKRVEYDGDHKSLFRAKRGFRDDSELGKLGSVAARHVLDRLRPAYWFASHLHAKFAAIIQHGEHTTAGTHAQGDNSQQPHASLPSRTPHPFGLDGTVMASLVSEEDQANGHAVPEQKTGEPIATKPTDTSNPVDNETSKQSLDYPPQKDTATSETTDAAPSGVTTSNVPRASTSRWPGPTVSQLGNTQNRLSAWNNFHVDASQREKAETARFLTEQSKQGPTPDIQHNLTWKKVDTDNEGLNRTVMGTEKPEGENNPEDKKGKSPVKAGGVKNEDEIDLDMASSSDRGSPAEETQTENENKDGSSDAAAAGTKRANDKEDTEQVSKRSQPNPAGGVSETIRSQLPASFTRPEPTPKPVNGPLPEAISNKTTHFLALDKCLPNRDFLQLVEVQPISESDGSVVERPYRLQYDKEWLAITRVFANDLELGNPDTKVPADKGDVTYKPQIEKEEQWIEENVVKPGKLAVPENFTPTAPFYDPAVPITTEQQPPEYTNPQTAQFCELIGIENKFHLSDEERQARMNAGPRPDRPSGFGFSGRNQGRGGYGRRGRGGGRGRGVGRH